MSEPLCNMCHRAPPAPERKRCEGCIEATRRWGRTWRLKQRTAAMAGEALAEAEAAELEAARPRTRGDCAGGERPCPWASCRHHLLWEQGGAWDGGVLRSDDELLDLLDRMPATCALDAADEGGLNLAEAGRLLDITRERMRQIETRILDPERLAIGAAAQRRALQRRDRLRQLLDGE